MLIIFVVIIVYPVVWMIFASFKSPTEIVTNIWGLPAVWQWENYTNAWENASMGYAILNSIVSSLATVVLVVILASVAGYAFAKFRFRYSLLIFLVLIFTMQAPTPVIPLYIMLVRLKLTDSLLGLVLPMVAGGLPLAIFIFRAFFQSIPGELVDAAKVDGCNEFSAFRRVHHPRSRRRPLPPSPFYSSSAPGTSTSSLSSCCARPRCARFRSPSRSFSMPGAARSGSRSLLR